MEKQAAVPLTAGSVPLPPITIVEPVSVVVPAQTSGQYFSTIFSNPLVSTLRDAYTRFQERREALGLSNPGTIEGVSREVQRDVLLTNLMFSGLRGEITRAHSATPLFHTAHNFTMGAQGMPPYSFAALYGSSRVSTDQPQVICNR